MLLFLSSFPWAYCFLSVLCGTLLTLKGNSVVSEFVSIGFCIIFKQYSPWSGTFPICWVPFPGLSCESCCPRFIAFLETFVRVAVEAKEDSNLLLLESSSCKLPTYFIEATKWSQRKLCSNLFRWSPPPKIFLFWITWNGRNICITMLSFLLPILDHTIF